MKNLSFYSIQIGNVLRGATDTRRVGEAYAVTAAVPITIKEPAFYDISHWKTINNWARISPHPLLMGTKATEADNYKDPTFPEYFTKMASIVGCRRLAYHFFRKSVDPVRQANWFVDFIEPYLINDDILVLDFEEGGETAKQLWAFLNRVKVRRPNNQLMNYSRKNLMDPIVMTSSEKEFFKGIPSWTAGYPDNPNLYSTTPAGYIPDPTKWGAVWAWQYTSHGQVAGIDGDTDCNLMEQALIDFCGGTVVPQPDDIYSLPFAGVERATGRRYNSDFYITKIDLTQVRVEVAHETTGDGLFRPSEMAKTRQAQLAWNGDEYIKQITTLPHKPAELAYSNGLPYVSRSTAVPSLNVRQNGAGEIGHQNFLAAYNVTSGYRYLIENGIIKSYLSGSEIQYTERHPRSCFALTQDGRLINLTVDGRTDQSAGMTLKECANVLKEFGAWTAYDRGSGGDTVDVMNGEIQNVPCDTFPDGSPGAERAVSQAILVYADGGSSMTYRYDATAIADGTRLRPNHNVNDAYIAAYPKGTVFSGDVLWVAPADGTNVRAGDTWLEVQEINGAPKTGWVAITHMGEPICTLIDHGVPPPANGVADMPYTLTFGGADSPYVETTISGVIEAK